ncbi:MAG: transglutaminase domain-containing protein [Candidatus Omnitrophica bacterium]|nr:transglutaminase domain-containing protein [Candidatus Omnitrophota bacterium]
MKHKSRSKIISCFFLLFWLVMISLLLAKEGYLYQNRLTRLSSSQPLPFREEWFSILYQDKRIGYLYQTTRPSLRKDAPYELYSRMRLSLFLSGKEVPITLEGSSFFAKDYRLKNLSYCLKTFLYQVKVEGKRKGDFLELEVETAGRRIKKKIKIGNKVLANSLVPSLFLSKLVPGTSFTLPLFDPLSLDLGEAKIEVFSFARREGKKLFQLKTTYQGIVTYSLVTEDGEMLEAETPLGLKIKKTSQQVALGKLEKKEISDLLKRFSVAVEKKIEKPEELKSLKLKISGVEISALLNERQQSVDKDTISIVREKYPPSSKPLLPITIPQLKPFLQETIFIQSEDREIREEARTIIGREKDSRKAAELLLSWVYEKIKKEPTFSLPSAVEVLERRVGDCNEHAILFTALARSIGIPTKIVLGLLYHQGAFYYHAWCKVFIGEWISLDPILNQIPTDCTHLELASGDFGSQIELIRYLGRIKIEIVNDD